MKIYNHCKDDISGKKTISSSIDDIRITVNGLRKIVKKFYEREKGDLDCKTYPFGPLKQACDDILAEQKISNGDLKILVFVFLKFKSWWIKNFNGEIAHIPHYMKAILSYAQNKKESLEKIRNEEVPLKPILKFLLGKDVEPKTGFSFDQMCSEYMILHHYWSKRDSRKVFGFQCPATAIYHFWKHKNIMGLDLTFAQYNNLADFLHMKYEISELGRISSDAHNINHVLSRKAKFQVSGHKLKGTHHEINFSAKKANEKKEYSLVLVVKYLENNKKCIVSVYQKGKDGANR